MFKKSYNLWLQKEFCILYPTLWTIVKSRIVSFPTSYLVERGFSVVMKMMSQRNRLHIVELGDLRLMLTDFKPDIDKLMSLHQVHPSHYHLIVARLFASSG
jgi:hypothetical protein